MRERRIMMAVTVVNLCMMAFMLFHRSQVASASGEATVLRARGLEIVDGQGRVRASIQIMPKGPARAADGRVVVSDDRIYPETVILRLIRADGRPTVKIATSEQGSGVSLGGGVDPAYVVLGSQGGDSTLALTDKDGKKQLIRP